MLVTYKNLKNVKVIEINEQLLSIRNHMPNLPIAPPLDMIEYVGDDIFIREGLINRLKSAQLLVKQVHPDYDLLVVYGYRHETIQKNYFEKQKKKLKSCITLASKSY